MFKVMALGFGCCCGWVGVGLGVGCGWCVVVWVVWMCMLWLFLIVFWWVAFGVSGGVVVCGGSLGGVVWGWGGGDSQ
jgi:hypothetical protein